jgi:transposase
MGQELGLMSMKEALRLAVMDEHLAGQLTQAQAAIKLGLSVRQVKRLNRRIREEGAQGLLSKRRGLASNRKVPDLERERVLALVRVHYADFGPELAREYLVRDHGFEQCTETLRGWMTQAGLWWPKPRRTKRIHSPRQRRACRGELAQIDASHHDWFEARAPKCCLIAYIDDATGEVKAARFEPSETTEGYLGVLRAYVSTHGAPLALYSDRHSIFTKHDEEDAKPTQFERAALQLGIETICAHSPQAKGRVERLFQTLQDRMCKAMRLAGVQGLKAANAWLPGYIQQHNQRFAVAPREPADMHRHWHGTAAQLAAICALHHQRQLSAQLACRFQGQILQLHEGQAHAPKASAMIDIAQYADGTVTLSYRGHALKHKGYACQDHVSRGKAQDSKTVNTRVDEVRQKERRRIAELAAAMEHQESQRRKGIYKVNSPANEPRAAAARSGLRPARAAAAMP